MDFGPGFYLTPLFEQASKWAVRIKTIRRAKQAIVNTYEFALPQDSKVKRFDAYDKEWLDFIVDSRKGKQPWSGYDIIEGGVADDRVIDAVEAYINGYADVEHTLRQLAYHKPNYQICILWFQRHKPARPDQWRHLAGRTAFSWRHFPRRHDRVGERP